MSTGMFSKTFNLLFFFSSLQRKSNETILHKIEQISFERKTYYTILKIRLKAHAEYFHCVSCHLKTGQFQGPSSGWEPEVGKIPSLYAHFSSSIIAHSFSTIHGISSSLVWLSGYNPMADPLGRDAKNKCLRSDTHTLESTEMHRSNLNQYHGELLGLCTSMAY